MLHSFEAILTRGRWRPKRSLSEPKTCFRKNQNKEKKPLLKISVSGIFSCYGSS